MVNCSKQNIEEEMKEMKEKIYFDYSGHLNDETIAMCARSIVSKEKSIVLPQSVTEHFEGCEACKNEILDFAEVITGNYDYLQRISQSSNTTAKGEPEKKQPATIRHLLFSGVFRVLSAAALLVVFVALSWWALRPVSAEKLFNQYYSPYNNILTVKNAGINNLNQGLLFYDLKMYDSAAIYFQQLLKNDPDNLDARFYLANSFLAAGKAHESIPLFLSLQKGTDCKYDRPSRWLLGLAYLRINNTDEARIVFRKIADEPNFYSEKAGKILKKLR